LVGRPLERERNGHLRGWAANRRLHSKAKDWFRSEDLVATFSLVALAMTVLVLIYQAMAI
jgi:hypothetical protein